MAEMYRHGDLLLVKTNKGLDAKNVNNGPEALVLAKGEVTGHAHVVNKGRTSGSLGQGLILEVVEPETVLSHEEHGQILLPVGVYEVLPQKVYSEAGERRVQD